MGLSLGLPTLIHIHTLIVHLNIWRSWYAESVVAFFNYFVDELVSNLTNHTDSQWTSCRLGRLQVGGVDPSGIACEQTPAMA